ncbi:MAG: 1-acyl-sn-glycerol-3-phosphate acyltransferase [Flavobacteriales bacterium]|jgi:1-acyl-sn-glycerol-3-phosphate acyltransferase
MISRILKILFFGLIVRPIVLLVLGLNIRNRQNLPLKGPAVLAPNHNSHLDTMVLLSLYPLSIIHKVRPVAAADYFMSNPLLAWFSMNIIGIIPLDRSGGAKRDELFRGCNQALDNGEILIVFPEGSRGDPEQVKAPKKGIYYLLRERNDTAVIPILMHGLGRALPRGEALLVPFNCDVIVGDKIQADGTSTEMLNAISMAYDDLYPYCLTRNNLD